MNKTPAEVVRDPLAALKAAGTRLSNIAYNLAQNDKLPLYVRDGLSDARKEWDAAIAALSAPQGEAGAGMKWVGYTISDASGIGADEIRHIKVPASFDHDDVLDEILNVYETWARDMPESARGPKIYMDATPPPQQAEQGREKCETCGRTGPAPGEWVPYACKTCNRMPLITPPQQRDGGKVRELIEKWQTSGGEVDAWYAMELEHALAQPSQQPANLGEFVIALLIAGGYVTQAKADEARKIALSCGPYEMPAQQPGEVAVTEQMVEAGARAICKQNLWDPDEAVTYSGTKRKVRNRDGSIVVQWQMHETNVRAALTAALTTGGRNG